nr:hypothetical protein [Bacteroidota bacterium]
MKKVAIVLILIVLAFQDSTAQDSEALARFNVSESEGGYVISWTIKAGYSCYNVEVEHSTDGIHYSKIFTYP